MHDPGRLTGDTAHHAPDEPMRLARAATCFNLQPNAGKPIRLERF
jgi:hypothetical protein